MFYLLLFALVAILWWLWRHTKAASIRADERDWLPPQLRTAILAFSERQFFTTQPFPLVAVVDRAYRTTDGGIVLVDFKRRPRRTVYQSDIVEISAQRLAMLGGGVSNVSERAFVVIVDPETEGKASIEVRLEDADALVRRRNRVEAIARGSAAPLGAAHPAVCRQCGHRPYCPVAR